LNDASHSKCDLEYYSSKTLATIQAQNFVEYTSKQCAMIKLAQKRKTKKDCKIKTLCVFEFQITFMI
jgi:hypothetical protein